MNENEEQGARLAQAFRSMADLARPGPDCPQSQHVWDAVAGQLPVERTREIVDHTSSCPSCAESWRLAHQLSGNAHEERPRVHRPEFAAQKERRWRWAAAAAAVVVLGAVVAQLWRTEPQGDLPATNRGPGSETICSLLVDGEALPRDRFLLRWIIVTDEAPRFHVRVATEDLETIALARDLEEPEYLVPEDVLNQIVAGERVLWQVEAALEDGSSATSQTFVNRLE